MSRLIFSIAALVTITAAGNPAQGQSTTWLGDAPFCSAEPADCSAKGMKYSRAHASGDGETCLIGTKIQCSGGAALSTNTSCPASAAGIKTSMVCKCSASQTKHGTIWGVIDYTADSSVCRAAVHAGVIPAGGGNIRIAKRPGLSSYRGSTANGVTTHKYGKYRSGFRVSK